MVCRVCTAKSPCNIDTDLTTRSEVIRSFCCLVYMELIDSILSEPDNNFTTTTLKSSVTLRDENPAVTDIHGVLKRNMESNLDYESKGRRFESCRGHHLKLKNCVGSSFFMANCQVKCDTSCKKTSIADFQPRHFRGLELIRNRLCISSISFTRERSVFLG